MTKKTIILGISCFYHDAAAVLLIDGKIVAAAQEERFTRKKNDADFPKNAIDYCLRSQNISINEIDYVAFYDKPIAKFDRLIQTYINVWPKGLKSFLMAMQTWLKEKLWIKPLIAKKLGFKGEILFTEHHYSHAASAFYCSPFYEAILVTMDGVGEWDTTTIGFAKDNRIKLTHSIQFPNSLGLLYSALTYYLGFKVNSAEYKVMGLAPYGNPEIYLDKFKKLIEIADDGSIKLNMNYFSYEYGDTMTNKNFNRLFGGPERMPDDPLMQKHKDIASSLQKITEDVVLKIVRYAKNLYQNRCENLCLAGGVALNCVANGKILKENLFKNVYIQPAAGDAGGAIGAACYIYYDVLKNEKRTAMDSVYLGPEFKNEEIESTLKMFPVSYEFIPNEQVAKKTAELLEQNHVVGFFQGKMEWGPRALGNRSILADARKKENWQRVNLKIKFRESFRPFAPSVMREYAEEYFDLLGNESPFMLLTADVKKNDVPAITHIDNSARIQTVTKEQNKIYYDVLRSFFELTACPVIINTSFNVRGEPIVCTPENALNCFINTDIDDLILGNFWVSKSRNQNLLKMRDSDYLKKFELD